MVKWRYKLGKDPAVTFRYKHYKLDIWTTHWRRPRHYSCDCSGTHKDWCSGWVTVFGPFALGIG